MQANTTLKRFGLDQLKAVVVAVGLAASVAVGAIAYTQTRDDVPVAGSAATIRTQGGFAQTRFMEMNTHLPRVAPAMRFEQIRFVEMNALPEAAPAVSNARLLEINTLPGSPGAIQQTVPNWRLIEINMLPGDDTPALPYGERGARH
jgi:hypothetical protein